MQAVCVWLIGCMNSTRLAHTASWAPNHDLHSYIRQVHIEDLIGMHTHQP